MITMLEKPEFVTANDLAGKFYPNAVLLNNCTIRDFGLVDGYVVATAPNEDYYKLVAIYLELQKDPANGEVFIEKTKFPLEGEGLFVETYFRPVLKP